MIKVWGRRSSSNVQAVMWCIAELGLEHTRIDAGFTYGVVNSDEYVKINPNSTVPTMQDGSDAPVWESGAIIRYLAASYGSDSFWPKEPRRRVVVDQWAEWAKINFAGKFTDPIFWELVRVPKARRRQDVIESGLDRINKTLTIADKQLASSLYLAGDEFTVADIQFGHCLYRYFDIDIPRKAFHNLQRYYDNISERAAFKAHVQVDYSELIDSM